MADLDLQAKIKKFQENLAPDQAGLRDNLQAETKALSEKLNTDAELKQARSELERLQKAQSGSKYALENQDYSEDIAEVSQA